jgi:uncharacterized cupredoxin-like copper-binding protein
VNRLGALALAAVILGGSGCARSGEGRQAIEIEIRHSRFSESVVEARVGRPLRVMLHNTDPIDHEWIVGDEATHERHATGTEPRHDERPTEVTVDALTERMTTVTFDAPGDYRFVCHLPGHEAYGMTGVVRVR